MRVELVELKGVKRKRTNAEFIFDSKEVESKLTQRMAVTSAGANGAINIWYDDSGKIRCESMRFLSSIETQLYDSVDMSVKWAEK